MNEGTSGAEILAEAGSSTVMGRAASRNGALLAAIIIATTQHVAVDQLGFTVPGEGQA
ncbi:hypothetical protein AiwAL_19195 [Acidiphilium sp. AL]|uniref:Uncharacterized protein n=1 Tax=Acidiphilium iwatense TaxID=768198 RepID=A0ABS9E181_9PROT|nr:MULTISPECIES: hypothetical protein [Acidiphilium]MCF3948767.1 hypothetical protein [Acidiphilium iwatense]MCU4162178.1 hypothetical protein [Acidiphilium sp. AL]